MRLVWSVLSAAILSGFCPGHLVANAQADENATIRTDLFPEIYRLMDAAGDLQTRLRQCPADLYGTQKAFWDDVIGHRKVKMEDCGADPLWCHRYCFDVRNPDACFALARTLQDHTEDKTRYYEALFAQACATGSAGGCTNRAAAIKNADHADEPFNEMSLDIRSSCTFRSFRMSCEKGDAWGCTMHGISYQDGEGVAADFAKAKEFYARSCAISPDFAACEYAKERQAEIE